jgi:hypothetical protein
MKINAAENVQIQDIEEALRLALPESHPLGRTPGTSRDGVTGRKAKIKLDKETLSVSLNPFQGATVRMDKTGRRKGVEVTAHMPAESSLMIASFLIASLIYQTMGRLYGIPAIVIAALWPILLGMLVSRNFANEVAEIVTNTSPGKEAVEAEQEPERIEVKVSPKAKLKACPNCGNPIRLASDLHCRKCGQKLR